MRKSPTGRVFVTLQRPGSNKIRTLERFLRLRSAENFIAEREKTDPKGVHRGDYGIDAPEEVVNPRRRRR